MLYEHDYEPPKSGKEYHSEDSLMVIFPSLSVADLNGDGFMDIYIPSTKTSEKNLLYINQNGKGFVNKAKEFGIDEVGSAPNSMAIFADFNNDGLIDLIQTKYGCHQYFQGQVGGGLAPLADGQVTSPPRGSGPITSFKKIENGLNGYCSRPEGINTADFNRDGKLDLIFGNFLPAPGEKEHDTLWMSKSGFNNTTGGRNDLLMQQNDGTFLRDSNFDFKTRSYTHSVGISDINLDGWPDIFFANDYAPDEMFLNQSGKSVIDVTEKYIPRVFHGYSGMNAEFIDFNQDGLIDLYVTNIYKPPFYRSSNVLWKKRPDGGFDFASDETGTGHCGFSWGAKFADFDNDGDLDLMVVNGRSKGRYMKSVHDGKSVWYRRNNISLIPEKLRKYYTKEEGSMRGLYLSAFERNCLFMNEGGKFHDVAPMAGFSDRGEDRGLVLIDYDNDGLMDLAYVSVYGKIKLYHNESISRGNWIGFTLMNHKGSSIPIGARAFLNFSDGKKWVREYYPANGYRGQSDPRLHFGLGKELKVKSLEVVWPDQEVEVFENIDINKYNLVVQGKGNKKINVTVVK